MNTQEAAEQVRHTLDLCGEVKRLEGFGKLRARNAFTDAAIKSEEALRVLLAAVEGQEGMVIIPTEPTPEIIGAMSSAYNPDDVWQNEKALTQYKAIISVARHTGSGKS